MEKYYPRLTYDFQTNKKIAEEVAIIPSKRLRNKIAGFATVWFLKSAIISSILLLTRCLQHLMKRISRGPVRGISLKLQEEERERRMDVVPDRSALDADTVMYSFTSVIVPEMRIVIDCHHFVTD